MCMASDQKDEVTEVEEEYDGPWIETRIEWQCPDNEQHDIRLFGSWNEFGSGYDLEYQGKRVYAVTAKLPLGNHVYRFMIDWEEWDTCNATAITVKDGIEYNIITVKQESTPDSDKSSNDNNIDNKNDNNDKNEEKTQLIFDEKKQKFVVNKDKGKEKPRGRPSFKLMDNNNEKEKNENKLQSKNDKLMDAKEKDANNGAWIEKRIEWKCADRKQHDVVLFGSWNRFRGGDDLEYQGKQIYAVTVKLPLGNYIYRFMIDGEEWETSNATPKTVKDGIEYNTITVKEGSDSDDDDDDDDSNDKKEKKEQN